MYSNNTLYKSYDCKLLGDLGALVSGITGLCNVRGKRLPFEDTPLGLPPGGLLKPQSTVPDDNTFCKLIVGLTGNVGNPLECVASDCSFRAGSRDFTCSNTQCSCPATGDCGQLINGVLENIKGKAITLACDTEGVCTLQGMQPQLQATCTVGECTQPEAAAIMGSPLESSAGVEEQPKPFPTVAFLSMLPSIILAAAGALGLGYVLGPGRPYFKSLASYKKGLGGAGQRVPLGEGVERLQAGSRNGSLDTRTIVVVGGSQCEIQAGGPECVCLQAASICALAAAFHAPTRPDVRSAAAAAVPHLALLLLVPGPPDMLC